jgi:hypothetical protein
MTRLGVYWAEGEDEDGRDSFVSLPECLGAFEAVQPAKRAGSLKKRMLEGLACSALLAGFVLVIVLVVDPSSGLNSPEKAQNLRLQVLMKMRKRLRSEHSPCCAFVPCGGGERTSPLAHFLTSMPGYYIL